MPKSCALFDGQSSAISSKKKKFHVFFLQKTLFRKLRKEREIDEKQRNCRKTEKLQKNREISFFSHFEEQRFLKEKDVKFSLSFLEEIAELSR
jgi:hypothetical protein